MHASLRAQPAVGRAPVDLDRRALETGLLTLLLVDDLGMETVALGPAEVHPDEHLRPVRGFRTAGARTDREQGAAIVVLAVEQQLRAVPGEVRFERRGLALELRRQLGVTRFLDELERREQVVRARREVTPKRDLRAKRIGFAEDLLRRVLVIPEGRRGRQRFELCGPTLLRLEVKDAPRST